jgi:hypothetical protein
MQNNEYNYPTGCINNPSVTQSSKIRNVILMKTGIISNISIAVFIEICFPLGNSCDFLVYWAILTDLIYILKKIIRS